MTLKIFAEMIVVFYLIRVWGAEFFEDMKFYLATGFDLTKQREANIFNGIIVKTSGISATAKFRFSFLYPLMIFLCLILILDILGSL